MTSREMAKEVVSVKLHVVEEGTPFVSVEVIVQEDSAPDRQSLIAENRSLREELRAAQCVTECCRLRCMIRSLLFNF